MSNTLKELNDYLFAQMERLQDNKLTGENLEAELKRSKAITDISSQIIKNGSLQLQAYESAVLTGINVKSENLLWIIEEKKETEKRRLRI